MAVDWRVVTLDDVAREVTVGYVGSMAQEYQDHGIPFLRSKNISPFEINTNDLKYVSPEFNLKIKKSRLKPGDVVIVRTGTPGTCAVIPEWLEEANCSDVVIARCGPEINERYLAYYVNTAASNHVNAHLVGAVQQHFNVSAAKKMEILLPPLVEQDRIVEVLGAIDDKITLNHQINTTLESMAQTLFKSWFVDFDPVIDNALAAGNPIPEALKVRADAKAVLGDQRKPLPDTIRQQFPDRFVLTEEMGWVPEGWRGAHFQDVALVIMGQSPKGNTYNNLQNGIPLVNGPVEFGPYFTEKTKWTTAPTKLAKTGDLIVCVRGSTTGRYVKSDGDYCLGRGVCAIRGKRSQVFSDSTYKHHQNRLLSMATGSTFPNWSGPTLKSFTVVLPPENIIDEFDKRVSPLVGKEGFNMATNKSLSMLRDTLLPKLLSGELRVPEAERQVELAM